MSSLVSIEQAIADIAAGKMIILVDDENRENEGDIVIAAEFATPEVINFMIKHARGLVCMPMLEADFKRLGIPMMVEDNTAPRQTAFGVSIEARHGVTTGISPFDRSQTILTAVSDQSTAADLVMPGHVFPLLAKSGGVLVRDGHTEGSVDLVKLAGLKPAAIICEVINNDGTMARFEDLVVFAKEHQLNIASIRDLQTYRVQHDSMVTHQASATLPVQDLGEFKLDVFSSALDAKEFVVLSKPLLNPNLPPLVRLHSACMTGDLFGSQRCDCGEQLNYALAEINQQGGYLLYLPQEGRGIGLANKIKAYALQEQGLDTVEANAHLGFAEDCRDYGLAVQVLQAMGVSRLRLLTNNPRKIEGIQRYGIDVVERVPIEVAVCSSNVRYLKTKREKLGHWVMSL